MTEFLEVRPMAPRDLATLELQPMQFAAEMWQPNQILPLIMAPSEAWTLHGLDPDGRRRTLCVAGFLHFTDTRCRVWTLISRHMTPRAWGLASARMRRRLAALREKYSRVEAECRLDFPGAHRLLVHHGFRYETHLPFAGPVSEKEPHGCTLALYALLCDKPGAELARLEALRALAFRTMVDDIAPPPAPAQEAA